MATIGDVRGIVEKYQNERGEDLALQKLAQKQKSKIQRPSHISREVFALMTEEELAELAAKQEENQNPAMAQNDGDDKGAGGEVPTMRKEMAKILKAIQSKDQRVDPWTMHKFKNPARDDELALQHWSKVAETGESYPFAKFNKSIDVVQYTDEEYKNFISGLNSQWSKADTDLLFSLCNSYQLKFIIVHDRYNFMKSEEVRKKEEAKAKEFNQLQGMKKRDRKCKEKEAKSKIINEIKKAQVNSEKHMRSIEQLKDRYYSVARAVLMARGDNEHAIVTKPFNQLQERQRRENNYKLLMRRTEDNEEEKNLLAELKKLDIILKKTEKEEKQLEKLVANERQRQEAIAQQEELIHQKMKEQKERMLQQQEQRKLIELEKHQELEKLKSMEEQAAANADSAASRAKLEAVKAANAWKQSVDYVVSEAIYEYFSKHAQVHQFEKEDEFEQLFIHGQLNEAIERAKSTVMTPEELANLKKQLHFKFSELTCTDQVYKKFIEVINALQESVVANDRLKAIKDFESNHCTTEATLVKAPKAKAEVTEVATEPPKQTGEDTEMKPEGQDAPKEEAKKPEEPEFEEIETKTISYEQLRGVLGIVTVLKSKEQPVDFPPEKPEEVPQPAPAKKEDVEMTEEKPKVEEPKAKADGEEAQVAKEETSKDQSKTSSKKKSKLVRPPVEAKPKPSRTSSREPTKEAPVVEKAEIISPLSKAVEDQVMKSDEPLMAKVEAAIAVGRERSSRAAKTSAAEKMSTQNKMAKATQKQYSSFLMKSQKKKDGTEADLPPSSTGSAQPELKRQTSQIESTRKSVGGESSARSRSGRGEKVSEKPPPVTATDKKVAAEKKPTSSEKKPSQEKKISEKKPSVEKKPVEKKASIAPTEKPDKKQESDTLKKPAEKPSKPEQKSKPHAKPVPPEKSGEFKKPKDTEVQKDTSPKEEQASKERIGKDSKDPRHSKGSSKEKSKAPPKKEEKKPVEEAPTPTARESREQARRERSRSAKETKPDPKPVSKVMKPAEAEPSKESLPSKVSDKKSSSKPKGADSKKTDPKQASIASFIKPKEAHKESHKESAPNDSARSSSSIKASKSRNQSAEPKSAIKISSEKPSSSSAKPAEKSRRESSSKRQQPSEKKDVEMKDESKKPSKDSKSSKMPPPPPQKKKAEPGSAQSKTSSEGKKTPAPVQADSKAKKAKAGEKPSKDSSGPKVNDTPTLATGERRSSRVRYYPEPDPVTATITSRAGKKKRKLDSGEGKSVEK